MLPVFKLRSYNLLPYLMVSRQSFLYHSTTLYSFLTVRSLISPASQSKLHSTPSSSSLTNTSMDPSSWPLGLLRICAMCLQCTTSYFTSIYTLSLWSSIFHIQNERCLFTIRQGWLYWVSFSLLQLTLWQNCWVGMPTCSWYRHRSVVIPPDTNSDPCSVEICSIAKMS